MVFPLSFLGFHFHIEGVNSYTVYRLECIDNFDVNTCQGVNISHHTLDSCINGVSLINGMEHQLECGIEWNSTIKEKSNHHDQYTVLEALCNKLCGTVQLIAHAFKHHVFCSSLSSLLVSSKPCIFNHIT